MADFILSTYHMYFFQNWFFMDHTKCVWKADELQTLKKWTTDSPNSSPLKGKYGEKQHYAQRIGIFAVFFIRIKRNGI